MGRHAIVRDIDPHNARLVLRHDAAIRGGVWDAHVANFGSLDVADVEQEVRLRLMAGVRLPDDADYAFMRRTARLRAIDALRAVLGRIPGRRRPATHVYSLHDPVAVHWGGDGRAEVDQVNRLDVLEARGNHVEAVDDLDAVVCAIAKLPPMHRRVVVAYDLVGLDMVEVGALCGLSESRVSQIRMQAFTFMRAGVEYPNALGKVDWEHMRAVRDRRARRAVRKRRRRRQARRN